MCCLWSPKPGGPILAKLAYLADVSLFKAHWACRRLLEFAERKGFAAEMDKHLAVNGLSPAVTVNYKKDYASN